MKDLL